MATQKTAKANDDQVELVKMIKDDAEIEVHPTCVESHQKAGWKVKPAE